MALNEIQIRTLIARARQLAEVADADSAEILTGLIGLCAERPAAAVPRPLAPADAATVEQARRLARAIHPDHVRMWFSKRGDELSARRTGDAAYVAGFGAAQSLLTDLARLAETPDRPGDLDYAAYKVARLRGTLADLAELADLNGASGALRDTLAAAAAELADVAAFLPEPIGADLGPEGDPSA